MSARALIERTRSHSLIRNYLKTPMLRRNRPESKRSHWIPALAGMTVRNRALATHPLRAMAPLFLVAVPGENFSTCGPAGRLRWHGSLGRRLPIAYLQPAFRQSSPASPRREDSRSLSSRSAKPGVGQPLAPIWSRTKVMPPDKCDSSVPHNVESARGKFSFE